MERAAEKLVSANKNVFTPLYDSLQETDPRQVNKEDLPELVDYQYMLTKVLFYSKLFGKASVKSTKIKNQIEQFFNEDDVPITFDFQMPYDEASNYFEKLGVIDSTDFYNDLDKYAGSAFTISNITSTSTLEGVQKYITDQLGSGKVNPNDLKKTIQEFAIKNKDDPLNPNHLNTVVTTNMQTAFSAGRYEALKDSPNPYWQYFNSDPKTDICTQLSGMVFKKDDPIWDDYFPPNHFNCHSTVLSMDEITLKEEGLNVEKSGKASIAKIEKGSSDLNMSPRSGFNKLPKNNLNNWVNKKCKELGVEKVESHIPVFKTTKEAETYLSNKLGIPVKLTGLKPEFINEISNRLIQLKDDYPRYWNGIKTVNQKSKTETVMLNSSIFNFGTKEITNTLKINRAYFDKFPSLDAIKENIKKTNTSGWWTSSTVSDLLTHEFGHCLTYNDFELLSTYKAINNVKPYGLPEVSGYAKKSMPEYLAESFVKLFAKENLEDETMKLLKVYLNL